MALCRRERDFVPAESDRLAEMGSNNWNGTSTRTRKQWRVLTRVQVAEPVGSTELMWGLLLPPPHSIQRRALNKETREPARGLFGEGA